MLDRLVIGTANWGRDYNGHNVSEKEQNLIMEYMKEIGIGWLDVATAYGTESIGEDFKRIVKISDIDKFVTIRDIYETKRNKNNRLMAHSLDALSKIEKYFKLNAVSLDVGDTVPDVGMIEYPYSIMTGDIPFDGFFRIIARSIFCKGKALKYFSPRECIDFVLMNPRIDKVILGVDSVDQLKENVVHLVKMEKFEHNEEVDTRKF